METRVRCLRKDIGVPAESVKTTMDRACDKINENNDKFLNAVAERLLQRVEW